MLGASYFFYGWWDWRFLSLLLLSTGMDYSIGLWLSREAEQHRRRVGIWVSVAVNLGLLGFFKYANFFAESAAAAAAQLGVTLSWTTLNVVLPIGISFYVFQTLSYTIDVYRREIPAEPGLLRFATFVALFPQLVAGPIVRASTLLPQLYRDATFDWARLFRGAEMVAWGFFLKMVLADNIAQQLTVDDFPFASPENYGGLGHIAAVFLFSFQIYGDFAGYSLIALGLGHVMGLDFGINFRRPYFAANFGEFWQRWHISLSTWLRDYLYIPLGGSREGRARTFRNLLVTMFLGGLWHGAAWTFVVWGLLHGAYLVVWHAAAEVFQRTRLDSRLLAFVVRPVLVVLVFSLTAVAWVFFRAESLSDSLLILGRVFTLAPEPSLITRNWVGLLKCIALIAVVLAVDAVAEFHGPRERYARTPALRFTGALLVIWAIAAVGSFAGGTFIYFQF